MKYVACRVCMFNIQKPLTPATSRANNANLHADSIGQMNDSQASSGRTGPQNKELS